MRASVSLIYVCITVTHSTLVRMNRMKNQRKSERNGSTIFINLYYVWCLRCAVCACTWRHKGVWLRCVHRLTVVNACCEFAESDRSREPSRRFFSVSLYWYCVVTSMVLLRALARVYFHICLSIRSSNAFLMDTILMTCSCLFLMPFSFVLIIDWLFRCCLFTLFDNTSERTNNMYNMCSSRFKNMGIWSRCVRNFSSMKSVCHWRYRRHRTLNWFGILRTCYNASNA